jgi:hypothetical protein
MKDYVVLGANKTGIFAVKSQRAKGEENALKEKVKECLEKNGRIR